MIRLALRDPAHAEATRLHGSVDELEATLRARFPELLRPLPAPDLLGVLEALQQQTPGSVLVEAVKLSPQLLRAYEHTTYEVELPRGTVALRPGVLTAPLAGSPGGADPAALPGLPGPERFVWLTACNPFSQQVSRELNAARLARLRATLPQAATAWPASAVGDDPGWPPEPGFLVLGLELEAARALGRSFGQNAILSGEGTGPPSIVPCFPGA